MAPVFQRAIAASKDPNAHHALRSEHDSFLLQLAVLVADPWLLAEVCHAVGHESSGIDSPYLHHWTLAMKCVLLSDRTGELAAWDAMLNCKYHKQYAWPAKPLVLAFKDRQIDKLRTHIRKQSERHWQFAKSDHALSPAGAFLPEKKHRHFYWPWIEAVFALILPESAPTPSFWLPAPLISCPFLPPLKRPVGSLR